MELFDNPKEVTIKGELDMDVTDDVVITIPKQTGKYSIDIHPLK